MRAMKFLVFIIFAVQISVSTLAKAAGLNSKHYENNIATDLGNDFGEIFFRWKEAGENTNLPEENSFNRSFLNSYMNNSERKRDVATDTSPYAEEFSKIFSIWQQQPALKNSPATRMESRGRKFNYSARKMPRISSDFGLRWDPITKTLRVHKGLDIPGAFGSTIYATANGVVREAGWRGSYGLFVEIEHSKSVRTRYAHLSRINVVTGQKVRRSDIVGFMGSTGRSTGSHLHYEIYLDGIPVDPEPFFREPNSSFYR